MKLTFSPVIVSSQDSSIQEISRLWECYLNSMYENNFNSLLGNYPDSIYERHSDSIRSLYWHDKSEDLVYNSVKSFMLIGELLTFSIRKYSDTIYEIHTLLQFMTPTPKGEESDILFIYRLCAAKTDSGFKLLNYFDVYKHSLQSFTSDNIEFYYPSGFNFDVEKVNSTEDFINDFRNDYNIKEQDGKIICVIGNNLSESNSFMGFDFTINTSENKYAGFHISPRTILTCRQDHIHEVVHALINPAYPGISNILSEGIATYYGGTAGSDYAFHRRNLQKYMAENAIDFSDSSVFWDIYIGDASLAYIAGALIIEYTLKNNGTHKVIELFSCKDYQDIFAKLEIRDVDDFFIQVINEKYE